jgi:hypothetical protein
VPVKLKLTLMDRKIPRPLSEKSNATDISIFKNMTFAHNKVMIRMAFLEYVIDPRIQAAAVDGETAGVVVEVPSVDLASDILTIIATTISEFL